MQDFKELEVWQKGVALTELIYQVVESFPKYEQYGLASQMRKAAYSIPCNLAEGQGRGTRKDYRQFVMMSRGSSAELETQIIIAHRVGYMNEEVTQDILARTHQVRRMLNGLIRSLTD